MNLSVGLRLGNFDVDCVHAFFAASGVIVDDIAFANVVDETCSVYENFLFRGVVNDEAKAFGFIEEFYCSGIH